MRNSERKLAEAVEALRSRLHDSTRQPNSIWPANTDFKDRHSSSNSRFVLSTTFYNLITSNSTHS